MAAPQDAERRSASGSRLCFATWSPELLQEAVDWLVAAAA
jgi:hypothetical protein